MTILRAFVLSLLLPCVLVAQSLNHSLFAHSADARTTRREPLRAATTVNVLAVMVQFQADTDTRTTGTGRFDTSHVTSSDIPIDAPPRNASYFEDHLTFLRHYFQKASKGKVLINTTLIPQVLTLPKVMSAYTPVRNGPTTPVAFLAYETWRMVDSLNLVAGSLSAYDAFVVFHAGVGHDIDMVSLLGYDPTDRDIPSLYFGSSAFHAAFGTQAGIPLKDGGIILNTLVLPETESRTVGTISGDALLEYGINGLLCASFGNYLGLPDLFDTKTGATAIGRFGLMDGQGFFSFNGVFPPEPSAWEKYWLGWVDPIVVPNGSSTLQLPAVALGDSIYRVPIGPREYYLMENRNRDPQRNGQTVTMNYNGAATTLKFDRDTTGFNFYDVSALKGNITDVEDLDWSLPGGVDDSIFYDGGILIWHIDERVIAATIGSNAVNADADHRGVDLEEADGSQDIGHSYGSLSAGSGSEIGTALDFWYLGNNSPINTNEFSARTIPSTQSNDGGDSHVAMKHFSVRGPHMSVVVSVGDSAITPLSGFPKQTDQPMPFPALAVGRFSAGAPPAVVVSTLNDSLPSGRLSSAAATEMDHDAKVYAWLPSGRNALPGGRSNGCIAHGHIGGFLGGVAGGGYAPGPMLSDVTGDGYPEIVVGEFSHVIRSRVLAFLDANSDSLADTLFTMELSGTGIQAPATSGSSFLFARDSGRIEIFANNGAQLFAGKVLANSAETVVGVSAFDSTSFAGVATGSDGSVVFLVTPQVPQSHNTVYALGHPITGPAAVANFSTSPAVPGAAVTTRDGLLYLITPATGINPGFPVRTGERIASPPALGDLNKDGLRDIVVFGGNRIFAYSPSGVMLDGFPVMLSMTDSLASAPILGDVNGDEAVDIIGVTSNGLVVAYDGHGQPVPGFPLVAGQGKQTAAIFTSADSVFLVVASSSTGSVSGWLTGRTTGAAKAANYPWPQYQHDARHSGVDGSAITGGVALSSEFFPKSRAYNWPNPVYDRTTQIRYYLKDDATVHIKIFDLAGDLVTTFDGPGAGGRDNEIAWDVSSVQSGVYLARIEATGSANSGMQVIKIAVVK
jgi:hypothetical protein